MLGKLTKRILLITAIVLSVLLLFLGLFAVMYIDTHIEKSIDENIFYSVGTNVQSKIYYYEDNGGGEAKVQSLVAQTLFGGYRCVYKKY